MTITPSSDPVIDLEIELLPDFGFSKVQDDPVFGPGSVFQGIVHLKMKETPLAADRIVIAFRGSEIATAIHDGIKFVVPLLKNQFFGIQQTLWQRTREECLLSDDHYQFPFTIQMPMIQFPPSMEHSLYKCTFELSAKLIRTTFTLPTVITRRTISYMPFIETSLSKKPVIEEGHSSGLYAFARLHSFAYVPGDEIPIAIVASRRSLNKKTSKVEDQPAEVNSISLELCQTVQLKYHKAISDSSVVSSHTHKLNTKGSKYSLVKIATGHAAEYKVTLPLPAELTPTLDYSKIINLSYQLKVKIKSAHSIMGPLRNSVIEMMIPLKMGTLGYGIHAARDLQDYYLEDTNKPEFSPRFLRSLEYEEALPLYECSKLPGYSQDNHFNHPSTMIV
ncbi:hypothetical protein BDB01DRAFT_800672 [Pilobolus umbonatus]|nr:hypothetical protein BDB01DRAFT_800672 [Pilobolus umbonatus]